MQSAGGPDRPPFLAQKHSGFGATSRRFLRWFFSWRIMRRMLFGIAVLITLIIAFYTNENMRGKRTWTKYKAQLEAQGERLDWAFFVPPTVPDEQNLGATPFFTLVMNQRSESPELKRRWPDDFSEASREMDLMRKNAHSATPQNLERKLTDFMAWEKAFASAELRRRHNLGPDEELPARLTKAPASPGEAATAVLQYLKVYEPVLQELQQASSRPACRFNVNWYEENPFGILLPHLAKIKSVSNVLKLRATAELTLGQTDQACKDLQLMLRLTEGVQDEPFLISLLVTAAMFRMSTDVLWEGLAGQQWSDQQLQEMQARLARYDFLAGYQKSLRAERAAGLRLMEYIRNRPALNRGKALADTAEDKQLQLLFNAFNLVPSGWLYLEEYNYARIQQDSFLWSKTGEPKRIDPASWRKGERKMQAEFSGKPWRAFFQHNILSRLLLPALGHAIKRAAEYQTIADEAMLACALERYRRANGRYPENLEALAPRFLEKIPPGVITGQPLIYRLTADGRFVLYSVGWDERDDGGLVARKQSSNEPHDWVWQPPAK